MPESVSYTHLDVYKRQIQTSINYYIIKSVEMKNKILENMVCEDTNHGIEKSKNMMSKILILFLMFCFTSYSQVKPENNVYITKFIKLIKLNDIEGIWERIRFPLNREYPIPPVNTKSQFVKRIDEIFDKHLKNENLSSTRKNKW